MSGVEVAPFVPNSFAKIAVTEKEEEEAQKTPMEGDDEIFASVLAELEAVDHSGIVVSPLEFEKDDDTNGHIDFIAAASNLRATNYTIATADRNKTKVFQGKTVSLMQSRTLTTRTLIGGHCG